MAKGFIIVISIILIIQIISICSFIRFCPVAKAGKVTKFYWKYKLLFGKEPNTIICDGEKINVSSYEELYVHGNSMIDYDIHNGQKVFVSVFDNQEKQSIEGYPVLAFHIYNMKCQSPYKLRKFVGYIDDINARNWVDLYHRYRERIKINETQFVSDLNKKNVNDLNLAERYILSETYEDDSNVYRYSLHPVSSLYAKVMYVV
ncbi:MAG: hypothetical protein HDS23_06210 [Bacteroides sp.]|nr:hypothetical protein [Bacteroides sp.]